MEVHDVIRNLHSRAHATSLAVMGSPPLRKDFSTKSNSASWRPSRWKAVELSKTDETTVGYRMLAPKKCNFQVQIMFDQPWTRDCSPPARWGLLDFITVVLLLFFLFLLLLFLLILLLVLLLLLHHLCLHFHVHFSLANSSPISSPTSARSGHCWTSTAGFRSEWARLDLNRKVLSAEGTAGPQPGTFRAQWAPLDLDRTPSGLSGHRWTSAARWNARIYARKTAKIYAT